MKRTIPKEKALVAGKKWRKKNKFKVEYIYKSYKSNAVTTGKTFDLTLIDFKNLFKQKCFYCGGEARGIDRINNKRGYTKENTICCCTKCNFAKGYRLTREEFILLAKKIAKNHKEN